MTVKRHAEELSHDDGVNRWRTTRMAASQSLRGQIHGYADYQEHTANFSLRRELPHAEGVLIVNLADPIVITGGDGVVIRLAAGEAFVAGAHVRPAFSKSLGEQCGIHVFLPLTTLRRLLSTPMSELVDRVVPLEALLGRGARELGEALGSSVNAFDRANILDEALALRLSHGPALDRRLVQAIELLRTRADRDISAIADDVGWSRKHLAARIRDAVGVGPRSFRRLLRFQKLTGLVGKSGQHPDWVMLALEAGYCDQSHMIREFREFSGLSPSTYLDRLLPDSGGLVEH